MGGGDTIRSIAVGLESSTHKILGGYGHVTAGISEKQVTWNMPNYGDLVSAANDQEVFESDMWTKLHLVLQERMGPGQASDGGRGQGR